MSDIFNKRPPKPNYPFTWDGETVLYFLRKITGNDLLSQKLLTLKVSMLSASQGIRDQKFVDCLTENPSVYTFAVPHLTKTFQRSKKSYPILKFYIFPGNNKLCLCKAIDSYLQRRNVWQDEESQFLVSHIKPLEPMSPSTVSRWLGQVLAIEGITAEVFKAHSTRSPSSSTTEVSNWGLLNRYS